MSLVLSGCTWQNPEYASVDSRTFHDVCKWSFIEKSTVEKEGKGRIHINEHIHHPPSLPYTSFLINATTFNTTLLNNI